MTSRSVPLALTFALTAAVSLAEEDPTGNWKMTIRVGHVGEGLRTVVLAVKETQDGYEGELTSMQNRMTPADEVTFDGEKLTVWYGSYEYELAIDGDRAEGTVTSPAGVQNVTAERQDSQLFAGDEPEPYQKTWRGTIERAEDGYVIATRRHRFGFVNDDAFEAELESRLGTPVTVTGMWRVNEIEILEIAEASERR